MTKIKIALLIKQVIDTRISEGWAPGADGTVDRNALPAIINPEDLHALEQALRLKEQLGGNAEIIAISMGPQRAAEALRECIWRGADDAVLISDRKVAGADTLATSYALALAIKKVGASLIFAGRQTIDGDTAHVGPQVAQALGIPQITYAEEVALEGDSLVVKRRLDDGFEVVKSPLKALITVGSSAAKCRFCNAKRMLRSRKAEIKTWSAADLDGDLSRFGLAGSPTQVLCSEPIVTESKGGVVLTSSIEDIATLVAELRSNHTIE
ncbi:MAG: electron transfer flavoprotein subunit beta/FixA family protein [Alistipes sp.]|nr:electron transfer flavoprotein subunit beta/FixA family protein [Alistipes sp.]